MRTAEANTATRHFPQQRIPRQRASHFPRALRALLHATLIVALALFAHAAGAQLKAGEAAPRLDIELITGRLLPAQAMDGKVVVQMFWATWCPYCIADMPNMQKLQDTYGPRGLVIVAVSLDRERSDVLKYWSHHDYTLHVAMRSREIRDGYGPIRGTPTYYLLDRKGVVRLRHTGVITAGVLESRIKELL